MNNSIHSFCSHSREQLRQLMRAKRLSLTSSQQAQAAQSLIPQAISLIESYQASHIAFYLPFNGEISPLPLMNTLLGQGKKSICLFSTLLQAVNYCL